jgi:hypothetical protein
MFLSDNGNSDADRTVTAVPFPYIIFQRYKVSLKYHIRKLNRRYMFPHVEHKHFRRKHRPPEE